MLSLKVVDIATSMLRSSITIGVCVLIGFIIGWLVYSRNDSNTPLGVSSSVADGYDNMLLSDKKGNIKTLLFPAGIALLWTGSIADIPNGWALCDGTNGTPDLRGRFVIGVNPNANKNPSLSVYEMGSTGGDETVTLSQSQMPSHKHGGFGIGGGGGGGAGNGSCDGHICSNTAWGISTDNAGGNQPHENRPPYYSLAYIMKLRD